jgi:glucose-1-phosphate adenylyltransferase
MQDLLTLILGVGRGTRLYPLTKYRSKPAVPIAGKYRLIDIPISNCLNSGLNRIYVLTQFLSVSLHRHIANTYKFDPFTQGFVEILPAQITNEAADWYRGTADAVRQNARYVQEDGARDILILSGDQFYRMDYGQLVQTHREHRADVTLVVVPVSRARASSMGVLRVDDAGRVAAFVENPRTEEQLQRVRLPAGWLERRGVAPAGREFLGSIAVYLFSRPMLFDLLATPPSLADFGRDVFPRLIETHHVQVHLYRGYWEHVETIGSYFETSLALAGDHPPFDFHSPEGVIYTRMRNLPASRVGGASMQHCLISDGCVVEAGARLERCSIGVRSRIGRNVTMRDAVLFGANFFETEAEVDATRKAGLPDLGVGDGSVLERVIVDKNCRIGRNVRITNRQNVRDGEGDLYVIRDGIVVLPNRTVVPDGTVI